MPIAEPVRLFLCGDVMTGRGIDQILPHPGDPALYEPSVRDAAEYVSLAERQNGTIPRPCQFDYLWGEALKIFEHEEPQAKIVNLETAITRSESHWQSKDVHYNMNPQNIGCLKAAGIDCATLANNHVLDWNIAGLLDTLNALDNANSKHAGAGCNGDEAQEPAVLPIGVHGRILVFSFGSTTSGIPASWRATDERPGVCLIESRRHDPVSVVQRHLATLKRPSDIVIASIHWGRNWGYEITNSQEKLAHRLIDEAGVDIIQGHSSHHVKAIEVYKDRLILYGCGDF